MRKVLSHTAAIVINRIEKNPPQLLARRARLCAGANLFDLERDGPAALLGVAAHGLLLQRKSLLIVS